MRNRSMVWAIALLLAVPTLATAQVTVSGRVIDASTRRPITAARVLVAGTSTFVQTDADGRYLLQDLRPGTQDIRAQLIGYTTVTQRITPGVGQAVEVDFALRQAVISMEEVVVTGTRPGAAARDREYHHPDFDPAGGECAGRHTG